MRALWGFCLVLALLFWGGEAVAGPLAERLASFPHWEGKPLVQSAAGDLVYPDWMANSWEVRSTLVDLVAPLAPDVVTPGFEGNCRYLNQPITFQVRFAHARLPLPSLRLVPRPIQRAVVADRAFNGLNLARAYLGDRAVLAVKVDPSSPNRQITLLRDNRQLVSVITGRSTETPAAGQFITTEVFQQLFRGSGVARPQAKTASGASPYFNQVETTTAYRQLPTSDPAIEADQVTAVYLSPQDPSYFAAGSRPVALYRYRLEFFKGIEEKALTPP
ncbi:MAG: hypothetical protein JOZ78_21205 [Chroococcidiopsidaceae cyanobacterium CP_BM_ER_R8_30]|nr:hypothetical protein [Chroococcidiopsidaceae cyanobacterium CP_BM_ER_R8_30]